MEFSPYLLTSPLSLTSYLLVSLILVYTARKMRVGRSIFPWLFLSIGIVTVSLDHGVVILQLFGHHSGPLTEFIPYQHFAVLGSLLVYIGAVLIFVDRVVEISALKKEYGEVRRIIEKLKKKYVSREITYEEFKKIYPNLVERLTELEVKIEGLQKRA